MDDIVNSNCFTTAAYKRSRTAYVMQCTFEYLITLLITDAFLAKLLSNIGISDALIGIISSFVSLAFIFQLSSIWLINRMKNVKRTVAFFDCLSQLLYIFMYCIPFLEADKYIKVILVIVAIMAAYVSKYMVASILFKWANSYVAPDSRGRFSAIKEMISLFSGMIFSLSVGVVIDKYEAVGNVKGGFIFIIVVLVILNILNFFSIMGIKDGEITKDTSNPSVKEILQNTLGNKNFKNVIILLSMWSIATQMTVSFMGIYKTKDLLLSVGLIQIINAAANGMRLLSSIPLGAYSDKKSYSKGIELALTIAAVGFFTNMFTTEKTWWLVIIYSILYSVSIAGTNANKFNITYSYVNKEYIAQAMVIQNSISGILGFGASLIGSFILSSIQKNNNMFLGIPLHGQQLLSLISFIIIICAIAFDRCVVEKQKVMIQ